MTLAHNRVVQQPLFLNNFPEKNREFAAICGKFSGTWERTARFLNKSNIVYRLYNLTYEEIKVIEPEFPLSRAEYEGMEEGG
jgi:hypothetical protein